jgi:hypothetical protein
MPGKRCSAPTLSARQQFRAIGSSDALMRATLLAGARHDPTEDDCWCMSPDPSYPYMFPLVH